MTQLQWRDPWYSIEGQSELQDALDAQLRKEMAPGHVLEGREAHAIGRRCDNDDVLYVLDDGPAYAVVHLTWRQGREEDAVWPRTSVFSNAQGLMTRCIEADATDYVGARR